MQDIDAVKARQKATWELGDFGRVAEFNVPSAEEFMGRIPLQPGSKFLDVACGTGNLAVIAARRGCGSFGLDLADNLIDQGRARAAREKLAVDFRQGDAEHLPYREKEFDVVASMYGVMFAPRPDKVVQELLRVTKSGGLIALANWTPEGFLGKMFAVFKKHLPGPPVALPSPLEWGVEETVHGRFGDSITNLRMTRQIARLRYPFPPPDTVSFFRKYYGPTEAAFAQLSPEGQQALYADLVQLQSEHNVAERSDETDTPAEYLQILGTKR